MDRSDAAGARRGYSDATDRSRAGDAARLAVAAARGWRVRSAAADAYAAPDAALDAAFRALGSYVETLRGAERCFSLSEAAVEAEVPAATHAGAAPATLGGACAVAAARCARDRAVITQWLISGRRDVWLPQVHDAAAAKALARCARDPEQRRLLLCRAVATGAAGVDAAADLYGTDGVVRVGAPATPADAPAVALRAALLKSAATVASAEARERSALAACRRTRPVAVSVARRWKVARDAAEKRRAAHLAALEEPFEALCRLHDDGEAAKALARACAVSNPSVGPDSI